MAASFKCIRVLPLCGLFSFAFLALTTPGVGALKFLKSAPMILQGYLGMNTDIDCSTDNPNDTVTLLHAPDFVNWVEKPLSPNKLILNGQVFTLLSLTINDGGKYNCKATDGSQTIQWPNTRGLMVISEGALPKHFILKPSKAIVVLEGGNVQITCEAEGAKVSKLHWEKKTDSGYVDVPDSMVTDETDNNKNLVRAILKITNAQQDDEADYKCVVMAYNKQDAQLISVRVDAATAPTFLNIYKPTPVKEGSEKVIKCDVKGSPKPTVHWYKNGEMLNITNCTGPSDESCKDLIYEVYDVRDTALHTTLTEQVLKIRSTLYPRDQGEFVCIAMNGIGPPVELAFDLDVQTGTILNKPSEPVTEYKGTSTKVSCSVAKSNPLPTFTWEYQDQKDQWEPVPENLIIPSTNTSTNHSVVLVDKDQPGTQYRCKAVNILGNDTHQVELVRQEKQKMIEFDPNSETQLDERSTLGLTCFNRCGAFCPAFFTKDGKKLSHKNDARVNVTMQSVDLQLQTVVLTIKNLTLNDSGSYRCVSSLDPNEYDTLNVTIIELVAPKIAVLPKTRNVVHGKDMWQTQLDCNVTGHPKPTITWFLYKDGERIQLNKNGNDLQGSGDNCKSRTDHYYFLRRDEPEHFVICNPDKENSGEYQCHASNSEGKATQSAFVNVLKKPEIKEPQDGYETPVMDVGHKLNVSCRADGNPLPNVTWVKNSTGEIIGTRRGSMQLVKTLEEDDFGSYKCIARNYLGRQGVSIKVKKVGSILEKQDDPPLSTGALVGIAIGVGLVVLIVLVICIVVYRRQKKQIDEYKEIYFLRQSDYQIDPDRSLLEQCNDLPYDADWEFPEERLILGDVLGAGAFGQVVKAEAIGILALDPRDKTAESFKRRSKIRRSSRAKDLKKEDIGGGWKNTRVPVAVKTLKEGATEAEYKDLASELKILIHLGQHKNIINLLGACTRGKRLMVIMEFAPHGSLLSFLRGKRDIYEPDWTKTMNNPEKEFTLVDLVMIGYQVSRGMAFLASKKCVHRDLAARNILVGDDYVMKIADFGLARDIYKDDLYVKKTQGLLPVKWMAPESLFDRVYTEKTDVWSFGILLWETFTLGGSPYPGLPTEQLLDYLSEGKRMDMPAKCPLEVYTIMRDCWIHEPDQRPPFTILNEHLGKILERNLKKENPYLALTMDDEEGTDSQGYYLQPCDSGIRDSKRYVESPVHSPTSEEGTRCDSPLPALPPGQPIISDDDIQNAPLPPLPPPYDDAMSDEDEDPKPRTSAAGESGIDVDGGEYLDNGGEYIDDARDDSPFLPHHGDKLVAIDMDGPVDKVPKAAVLNKGQKGRIETQL